ncbi:MAG: protein kinase, partial [Acidobacteria bacterium]|nr:protein kinase [Acidobacteriota bacterium]
PDLVANRERRQRFLREARTAAALNHSNIAQVHEVDEDKGIVFIVMELVEGRSLRKVMGGKPMRIGDALGIASEMADGLACAHAAHIIHRDLKPENIMVTAEGHAKILDFGLAKVVEHREELRRSQLTTLSEALTIEGRMLGTPAYMSPEQARGRSVDARSDLFSFGTTLYQMVTGRTPFQGTTAADLISSIIRDEPGPASRHNPEVPPELDRIVAACLEKDPLNRYQHADQLAIDLKKLRRAPDLDQQTAPTKGASTKTPPTVTPDRATRHRVKVWGLLAVLAVVLAVAGTGLWKLVRPAGAFQNGESIIVADFDNRVDQREFDTSIRDAFEQMLGRSTFIRVLRGLQLAALVTTANVTETSRIDRELAERLCLDGDCVGFLIGNLDRDGDGYRLEAGLHRAGRSSPVIVKSATVPHEENLLAAIHEIVLDLRQALGESPQAVTATPRPTTRSLRAYQTYAIGNRSWGAHPDEQVALFKRALALDPDFFQAHIALGYSFMIQGEHRLARESMQQAHSRSSGLSEETRLWNEINFLGVSNQFHTQLERLRTYRRLYPLAYGAATNLAVLYLQVFEDWAAAEKQFRDAYRLTPNSLTLRNLAFPLARQGKADEIERLAADFEAEGGSAYATGTFRLWIPAIRGNPEAVLEMVERLEDEVGLTVADGIGWRLNALLLAGRLVEAEQAASIAHLESVKARDLDGSFWRDLLQTWLQVRRTGRPPVFSDEQLKPAMESMLYLPGLTTYCVELGCADPLERVIPIHEAAEEDSDSRFVREELQFARGCLALIRGEHEAARVLLEPLARDSTLFRRHWALARLYEALERWPEAADRYEAVLRNPHEKWFYGSAMVLNEFHLARVYEKLGDIDHARSWYERFTEDWKDADPDIPELIVAREKLAGLRAHEAVSP